MFVCGGVLVRVYTVSPNQPLRWKTPNMIMAAVKRMGAKWLAAGRASPMLQQLANFKNKIGSFSDEQCLKPGHMSRIAE